MLDDSSICSYGHGYLVCVHFLSVKTSPPVKDQGESTDQISILCLCMLYHYVMLRLTGGWCWQAVMAALEHEGTGQGPAKRPQVPGLIDAGLVPLQSLMHHCWHQVSDSSSHLTVCVGATAACASRRQRWAFRLVSQSSCFGSWVLLFSATLWQTWWVSGAVYCRTPLCVPL